MKTTEAVNAYDDPRYKHDEWHIRVVTKTGCEYAVSIDVIDVATDGFFHDDGYIYGTRINGVKGGPFRRGTEGQLRWFWLRNVSLQETHEGKS